jgi:hypothetical protein
MRSSASNANTVAPLDNAIEVQQQAMRVQDLQSYDVRRSRPTAMMFADVSYDAEAGQFRSRTTGTVANQVVSATGITVDVHQMRRASVRQSRAHNANQVSPTQGFGGTPCATPTHLVWPELLRTALKPTSEARGVIILMPNLDRPFANNGKPSPHECIHYHLLVAIGPFSTGDCMRYYQDMVAGRTTTLNARVIMRPIHRTALPLLLSPDSVFLKLRKCSTCGHTSMRMKRCCKCTTHYCNVSCQLGDWPDHRTLCNLMHQVIYKDPRRSPHNARLAIYQSAPLCPQFYLCTSIEAEELLERARQIPESIIRDGNWMPGDEYTMLFERSL